VTAERLLVWVAAAASVVVAWLGVTAGVPALPERPVVVGLGVIAGLPLVVVAGRWLVSIGPGQRGWT